MTATPAFVEWSLNRAISRTFPKANVPRLGTRLCLGAGEVSPEGWICLDTTETYKTPATPDVLESGDGRYRCDIQDLDWIPDRSCSVVYAHHVIEHLPVATQAETVAKWAAKVKPGGFLYLCQPDLAAIAARTLEATEPGSASKWFEKDRAARTWPGDSRAGLSPVGYRQGTVWWWLYLGGDHRSVPTEQQVRACLNGSGLDLRRVRKVLTEVDIDYRLFVALEACYLGRRPPE